MLNSVDNSLFYDIKKNSPLNMSRSNKNYLFAPAQNIKVVNFRTKLKLTVNISFYYKKYWNKRI